MSNRRAPPPLDPGWALFLDVDGTLIEIAPQPEAVQVPAHLPRLLQDLQTRQGGALALVSGRPIAAIDALFSPWRGAAAGLHGGERRLPDGTRADVDAGSASAALDRVRALASEFAERRPGVRVEDKGRSLALHYRTAPERAAEVAAFAADAAAASAGALRPIAGKMVVELVPRGYGKGGAIAAFLAEPPFRGRRPAFLGDDVTDEEGFAEIARRDGVAIRVGRPDAATAASYVLPSVAAVLAWLVGSSQG